ncbi:LIM/homeobox protein Awh isoform X1 [Cloeon dipterum]|uniref:LIM/homeobox protein Awh isoform X1 n=1 Tax=Cloeon dipterum TaxID=197152 RepID=UPI00321F6CD1
MKTENSVCFSCGECITDKYLLQVNGRPWHAHCLRCCVCQLALDRQPSCFIKEDSVYCKADYAKSFGAKCAKCFRAISATDWVRKARQHVYHLACFACDACKRQLSTGEEFALHDGRVLCKTHYLETIDGGSTSSDDGGDSESYQKNKAKRVRTTFTEEQLQVLQANFQLDSNPDGQDLERIAQITGLSKRVTQVWFQNSRARQKKHLHTGKIKSNLHHHSNSQLRDQGELSPCSGAVPGAGYGRHINLHLTYSLQQQNNNNNNKGGNTTPIFSPNVSGENSSIDEMTDDSLMTCMRGEV